MNKAFIGSALNWQDQASARLCQLLVDENDGLAQEVKQNSTALLDLKSKDELERKDDLGLCLDI